MPKRTSPFDDLPLLSERVNLRTVLVALSTACIGFLLLYVSSSPNWKGNESLQVVIRDLGGLLVITVAVTLLWELWAKRAFLDEVLAKARVAEEIKLAGLLRITDAWHRDIDWDSYIRNATKIDIYFAYGHTWRSNYDRHLKEAVTRRGTRMRVVLPDPSDEPTIVELARRFNYTPERLKELIIEAETYFRTLGQAASASGASVAIWYAAVVPLFAFYRFDRLAVFTLYSHSRERTPIPAFVVEMGGTLYDFVRKEFNAMIREDGGIARQVSPGTE